MKKQPYQPRTDSGKMLWLQNFNSKLTGYKIPLDITTAELTLVSDLTLMFNWLMTVLGIIASTSQEFTSYKNDVRNGVPGTPTGAVPALPTLPAAPPTVNAGGFVSIGLIVQRIKNHKNYTDTIGQDLQIEGAETVIDSGSWKPTIKATQVGNKIDIGWKKQDADGIDIYVDRNDGHGWQFLARDTQPGYVDTTALPASGQTATWSYKSVYVSHDEQVGNYSDQVSLAVKGV